LPPSTSNPPVNPDKSLRFSFLQLFYVFFFFLSFVFVFLLTKFSQLLSEWLNASACAQLLLSLATHTQKTSVADSKQQTLSIFCGAIYTQAAAHALRLKAPSVAWRTQRISFSCVLR